MVIDLMVMSWGLLGESIQGFDRTELDVGCDAGHSKGGNDVLLYTSKYDDVPYVVNISGRWVVMNVVLTVDQLVGGVERDAWGSECDAHDHQLASSLLIWLVYRDQACRVFRRSEFKMVKLVQP